MARSSHLSKSMSTDFGCLADIPEAEVWTSTCPLAFSQLSVEQVLGDYPIFRTREMSKPAESALLEEGDQALESISIEDLSVRNEVTPFDGQTMPQISQMECVESLFLA